MLRSLKEVLGYKIQARDGQVGKVEDFFFDDKFWVSRYLVVDTGSWLVEKQVLISPESLEKPEWSLRVLPVNLTIDQIENSPDVDSRKPVSRQHEAELAAYYSWPQYWSGVTVPHGGMPAIPPLDAIEDEPEENEDGLQLRSAREVMNYHIRAEDAEIGHVEDFVFEDNWWVLRYMIVDTKNWWTGKKVLISPQWVDKIDWPGAQVHVGLTRENIKKAPEYNPSAPVNREYEERLFDFYGRPKYW